MSVANEVLWTAQPLSLFNGAPQIEKIQFTKNFLAMLMGAHSKYFEAIQGTKVGRWTYIYGTLYSYFNPRIKHNDTRLLLVYVDKDCDKMKDVRSILFELRSKQ